MPSGLAAALTLAEGGAKVVVFEKQKSLGGTSNFFQGTFAVESDMQRERYVDYTRDQCFKNTMDYSHWLANPRLVRAIIDESGATISWLQSQGVVFIDATINMPESPLTYHIIKGAGEAVVKALVDQAKAKGVTFLPGTPVTAILKEGNRVSGVIAESDGDEVEMAVKAVMVTSGGYANNKEWIKKYTGYDLGVNLFPVGNTGKTGDGLRMAWEVGAAEEGVGTIEMFRVGSDRRGVRDGLPPRAGIGPARPLGDRPRRALLRRDHHLLGHAAGQRPRPLQEGRLHLQLLRRFDHRAIDDATASTRAH